MTLLQSFLLGVLQGLTEFIPVSSTAHLVIAEALLGIPSDGKTFAFSVMIQLGTVASLLFFFWKDVAQIVKAWLAGIARRKPFEDFNARLGWLVILATLPALAAGFLLKDAVRQRFADPLTQGGLRLLATAALLTLVEFLDKRARPLESASWLDALAVGVFQILSIFPGASRSGSTIAGGMMRGFSRPAAARFAFLMSAPILTAAGLYEGWQVLSMPDAFALLPHLIVGFLSAAAVGWLSIQWLLRYLGANSLYGFAVYCAALGSAVFLLR